LTKGRRLSLRQLIIVVAALTIVLSGCSKDTPTPAAKPGEAMTPITQAPATTTPAPGTVTPPAAGTTTPPATTPPATTPPVVTPAPAPVVPRPDGAKEQPVATPEQLEKVDFGMTYDDVGKAMGQIGKLTSETQDDTGVNKIQTYEYKKKDGGVMKVTFRDGKVTSKSESSK
jgi:outer membrane protein assembly factor BamE (lipoprotein component of BamABCDE complex)